MNINSIISEIGKKAKIASESSRLLSNEDKNNGLQCLIRKLEKNSFKVFESNKIDIENANKKSLSKKYDKAWSVVVLSVAT